LAGLPGPRDWSAPATAMGTAIRPIIASAAGVNWLNNLDWLAACLGP